MTIYERAAQIWSILGLAASNRQILTYGIVGKLMGVPQQGLGRMLEPVQSFCILNQLPPLTILVVSETTGEPGAGFVAAEDIPKTQLDVFNFDWISYGAPAAESLEKAADRMPSNGVRPPPPLEPRPLPAVLDEIGREAEERGLTAAKLDSLLRDE